MADGIVTTGHLGVLAKTLERKLGRRVVVHRVEHAIPTGSKNLRLSSPGFGKRGTKTEIRYSIGIAGANPPVFFGMTVNEAKGRMAMLSDLLISGVIRSGSDAGTKMPATSTATVDGPESEEGVSPHRGYVGGQPPRADDSY